MKGPLLMLAPPVIWALQQQLSYALTASACEARADWWLHALTVLAVLAVAGVMFLAWSERRRFFAAAGLGNGAFFLVVILATELPNWLLGACAR